MSPGLSFSSSISILGLNFRNDTEVPLLDKVEFQMPLGDCEVYVVDGRESSLQEFCVILVELDLPDLGAAESMSDSLAEDISGGNEIIEESFVYGRKGAGPWDFLLISTSGMNDGSLGGHEDFDAFLLLDLNHQSENGLRLVDIEGVGQVHQEGLAGIFAHMRYGELFDFING